MRKFILSIVLFMSISSATGEELSLRELAYVEFKISSELMKVYKDNLKLFSDRGRRNVERSLQASTQFIQLLETEKVDEVFLLAMRIQNKRTVIYIRRGLYGN